MTGDGASHKWWSWIAVALGILMATLDSGIVAVSLPVIMAELQTDVAMIQWTILAYLVVITVTLLAFGRLADIFGRKQIFLLGFAVFTIGSTLCGLASDAVQLAIFRAVQALGASMQMANGMAINGAIFPSHERGKVFGMSGMVVAIGTTIGPTIGGLLTEWLGWRYIFFVNIPIGILGIALGAVVMPSRELGPPAGARPRFDFAGALLAALGLLALLFAISGPEQIGLPRTMAIPLYGLALCALVAFVIVERRVREPMIDLSLFRLKLFVLGCATSLLSFLGIAASMFLVPFYLQLILLFPPSQAGLLMTPTSLSLAVAAPISGWLSDRFGARSLASLGLALVSLGLFASSRLDATSTYNDVLVVLVLVGLGQGVFQSPNNSAVFGSVARERYGVTGGFLSMMRNLGMVMGTALATTVLVGQLSAVAGNVDLNSLGQSNGLANSAAAAGFLAGMERAYLVAAAISAAGIVASLSRGGSFRRPSTAALRR